MPAQSPTVARLQPFAATVFAEMTELAVRHDAVNLGQGFPDSDGPAGMLDVARGVIADGGNQYPPGRGMPVLRRAVAADRAHRYGTHYDPDSEVLVTVGATEAVTAAVLGLVEPGAEVVLIEPFYDSYPAAVALAGAHRRTARLTAHGDRFVLDHDSLRAAVTPATRMLILNSPHNPTGTVLDRADLAAIAEIACAHDLLVVTDEVYEHLVYDGAEHLSIATLPGMAERTSEATSSVPISGPWATRTGSGSAGNSPSGEAWPRFRWGFSPTTPARGGPSYGSLSASARRHWTKRYAGYGPHADTGHGRTGSGCTGRSSSQGWRPTISPTRTWPRSNSPVAASTRR